MTDNDKRHKWLALWTLAMLLGAALLWSASGTVAGGTPSAGGAPTIAGSSGTDVSAGRLAELRDRARVLRPLLGLGAEASISARHVVDDLETAEVDELTAADGSGLPLWTLRFQTDDRLVTAVRFAVGDVGRTADPSAITAIVERLRAGLVLPEDAPGTDGIRMEREEWRLRWERTVDGLPVMGDGAWLHLRADGTFHLYGRSERPLAPRPGVTISASDAVGIARRYLDAWFDANERGDLAIGDAQLQWVAPNAMFRADGAAGSDPVMRLSWTVQVSVSGTTGSKLSALEIYLDAGTGELLGGDVAS